MDLSKGDAARERHRGGYEKWEGGGRRRRWRKGEEGWSRSEKPTWSGMEEDGARAARERQGEGG